MQKYVLFIIITLSSFLLSTPLCAGGGWTKQKNTTFLKLSQWWVVADQHFTNTGAIDPNVTSGIFNTSIYAEYGITNRLTTTVYFPFFSRSYFNNTVSGTTGEVIKEGEAINSVGDTDISLKYGILQNKPVVVSGSVTFGLPLGNSSGGSEGALQTGDGEFNQLLRFDASTAYSIKNKVNTYLSVYTGFNNRTKGFSDEFRYGLEVGALFWKDRIIGILRFDGVESLQNGDDASEINSTSIFANNTEYLSFSPEIAVKVAKNVGVSFTYGSTLKGRIIFANPSYSFGVFVDL